MSSINIVDCDKGTITVLALWTVIQGRKNIHIVNNDTGHKQC
jgi:hypothetical protein